MRSDSVLLGVSMFITIIIILASKPTKRATDNYVERAISQVNAKFKNDLHSLQQEVAAFDKAVTLYGQGRITKLEIRQQYDRLRSTFKTTEFLIEYLDKEAYDKQLNGAPLPKLEQKVSDWAILQPRGLQVIDELLVSDLETADLEMLAEQSKKLKQSIDQIAAFMLRTTINDRQFFEASRQAILRAVTLGITGFDTPGTAAGVVDTHVVLNAQTQYLNFYHGELSNIGEIQLLIRTNRILQNGLEQTKNATFNDFDRAQFIRDVANPLYANILNIHLALDYETIEEVSRYAPAVNYKTSSIFDEDFLNPFYFVSIANDSSFNAKAKLGKLLFYDPVLSNNNEMSCASCHAPQKAFTDGLRTSKSNSGLALKRNSMTLNYSVYATAYFHDLRVKRLEDQFEHVVFNDDEFNSSYQEIIDKLKTSKTYLGMFEKAFPDSKNPIRQYAIDYALAAYVMKLNSFDSPVDKYFEKEIARLPEKVKSGFNLFAGKAACATCHFIPTYSGLVPPLYIESEAEILGVPERKDRPSQLDDDLGRLGNGTTREVAPFFQFAFKTPTVRNIEKTGPYMHNGVFDTLEEIMDFYNDGGGAGRGMDLEHQTLPFDSLELTPNEISDIIAFMNALTDATKHPAPNDIPRDFKDEKMNSRLLK